MKKYKGFQLTWWLTFSYIFITFLVQGILFYFFPYMNQNILSLLSQTAMLIPLLSGFFILKRIFPYDTLSNMTGIKGFDITFLIPLMILPVCSSFFISYVTAPVNIFIYTIFGEYDPGLNPPDNLKDFIYIFTSLCIIAPFAEEFLFRGIMLKLLDRYGTIFSVIVSSAAFSFLHFNPAGFIPIFFLGIILALLKLGTGSILACIVFHLSNNFFSFLVMIFEKNLIIPENILFIFSVCAAALFPVLLFVFFKFYSNKFYFSGTGEKPGFSMGLLLTVIAFSAVSVLTIQL